MARAISRGPLVPVLVVLLLSASRGSRAEPRPAESNRARAAPVQAREGTVVAIDSGELVVDLGAAKGAKDGDLVELWRPMRVRHPVTGAVLNERFLIGSLRLRQVREALSLAVPEGATNRVPATGDVVVAQGLPPAPSSSAAPQVPAEKPKPPDPNNPDSKGPSFAAPMSSDAQLLGTLMEHLAGAEPNKRARAYRTFAAAHPESPYRRVLLEEAAALTAAEAREKSDTTPAAERPRPLTYNERSLVRVRAGLPQRHALELDERFRGAVLHVRRKGAASYRSLPMQSLSPRYWTATLPGDAVADPGLEYFVEGVLADGTAVAVVGAADSPREVSVETLPSSRRAEGRLVQVTIQSEFASFNVKKANDYVFQTEGAVGYRMRDVGLRAVRSGFGVLRGEGGSLRDLDELGLDPSSVGLTYGYIEGEVAPTSGFSFLLRPILGLREGGVTGGAQGFVRIGNDLRTNLSIGGEVLGTVGQRGIVQLEWRTVPRVPIVLRTEVTNQPASSRDVGARAIAQIGYQFVPDLTVSARFSYQGRTINHAGPGAGLAVSYQW